MLEKLLREIKKLEGTRTISITVQLDEDGFLDRCCPAEQCSSHFKVLNEHWREKVPDDQAWCPFCGGRESPPSFNTPEQNEHLKKAALAHVERAIHRGLTESARDFNRRQPRNSFVSMKMDVRSPTPAQPLPPAAAELMRTEFACAACECRYRVVGSAYFCPACGICSADQTFDQTVLRVRKSVALFSELAPQLDKDNAAVLRTQLLEGGLSDLVTAFQYVAEQIFPKLPNSSSVKLRRNQFQNLTDGSTAWVTAGGRAFAVLVDPSELDDIERLFQQRHLLEHREGFVDQPYVDRTRDTTYMVGARITVREANVQRLADLVEKLANGLRRDVAGAA